MKLNAFQKINNNFLNWWCEKFWPLLDPQKQFFGIQLDITNACNLRCSHCYHDNHKNDGALTYQQWLYVLEAYDVFLKKVHMSPRVTICGGEPFLVKYLFSLLDQIRMKFPNCELKILTNGTLINDEIAQKLKKYALTIQVSVDGPDEIRHELIRGKSSFQKTMAGCSILKKHNVPFCHLAVLSRRTSEWIEDFFTLAEKTGAYSMNFTRLIVEGAAKKLQVLGEDQPLISEQLKCAMEKILYYARKSSISTSTQGPLWHLIEDGFGSPSDIGFSGIVIGYRGDCKVTSRVSFSLGNIMEKSLTEMFFHHPVMKRLRSSKIDECGECKFFKKCRGDRNSSFAEYGHFFGKDPGCWLLSHE